MKTRHYTINHHKVNFSILDDSYFYLHRREVRYLVEKLNQSHPEILGSIEFHSYIYMLLKDLERSMESHQWILKDPHDHLHLQHFEKILSTFYNQMFPNDKITIHQGPFYLIVDITPL